MGKGSGSSGSSSSNGSNDTYWSDLGYGGANGPASNPWNAKYITPRSSGGGSSGGIDLKSWFAAHPGATMRDIFTGALSNSTGSTGSATGASPATNPYTDVLAQIKAMLPTEPQPNTFLTGAQNRYNEVMGSGYKAISDEELNRMFTQRKTNLYKDVINPEDEKLAAKLAISGQTGGGVAGGNWEDKSGQNKRLLSDVYNEIQDLGLNQTLSDKSQAFGLSPSFYNMESSTQQYPLSAWERYAQLVSDEENRKAGINAADRQSQAQSDAKSEANKAQLMGVILAIASKFI